MVVKEENQYAGAQDPKAGDKTVQQSRKQGILLEILERICKGKENIAKKNRLSQSVSRSWPACANRTVNRAANPAQSQKQDNRTRPAISIRHLTEAKGRRSIQIRIRKQRNKVSSMFPVGV